MPSRHSVALALLAGCALVWLTQLAQAVIAAAPGLRSMFAAFASNGIPFKVAGPIVLHYLPPALVGALVGLVVLRLPGPRALLLAVTLAPLLAYAAYANYTVFAGVVPLSDIVSSPHLWASLAATVFGLAAAVPLTLRKREA